MNIRKYDYIVIKIVKIYTHLSNITSIEKFVLRYFAKIFKIVRKKDIITINKIIIAPNSVIKK